MTPGDRSGARGQAGLLRRLDADRERPHVADLHAVANLHALEVLLVLDPKRHRRAVGGDRTATLGTAASIAVMTTLAVTTCATAPPGRGPVSLTTVGSFAAAAVAWPGAPYP